MRKGLIGGGILAATAAASLAVEKYAIGRIRTHPDPDAAEPFGHLPADRVSTVVTDDGVPLHVEEVGPTDASLTVLFVHGYALDMGCWHYQRSGLRDDVRMVFYDHRSHGRSGRGTPETATIEQLATDLRAVIEHVDSDAPIVLVGHSMGGMAILCFAGRNPELLAEHIGAVALISTSAGRLGEVTFGLPAPFATGIRPVQSLVVATMRHRPRIVERSWRVGRDLAWLLTRHYAFGSKEISPALVGYVESVLAANPADVIAEFQPAFSDHDESAALPALRDTPTLIVVGERDLLTPRDHSEEIAAVLPGARLAIIEGAGHVVMMERAEEVNALIRDLLGQVG